MDQLQPVNANEIATIDKLSNKELLFCEGLLKRIATGKTEGQCYAEAGFGSSGKKDSQACALRLLKKKEIQDYLAEQEDEIDSDVARRTGYTRSRLIFEFERIKDLALSEGVYMDAKGTPRVRNLDLKNAIKCLENIAKITHVIDANKDKDRPISLQVLQQYFPAVELK